MPCRGGGSGMLGAGYWVFTGKRKMYVHFKTMLVFVYSVLIAHSFVIMTVLVEHYKSKYPLSCSILRSVVQGSI